MKARGPCWQRDDILRIVATDAEEIADHVLRAVHCPSELKLADVATGARYSVDSSELISKFLAPERRYVQVAVLGQAGTGKSHLIQWLRLNLPFDPTDMVLTIPKVGTSLRGIVEKIISRLDASDRPPFEEKLKHAGSQATTEQGRVDKFLDALAWTIEHGHVADLDQAELSTLIPNVLRDPNFRRNFFSSPQSRIGRIVSHIFVDPASRGDEDQRREFFPGDLPLSGKQYLGAAMLARDAIDYINGESGMENRAIALMTQALEPAIAQTLNFSADDLIALMRTLRIHLGRQKRRLLLLIEDFSRLQGIDTALLQALVTPPRQDEDQLCELRWAMALTSGRFELLDDTVKSRCTFIVDMDQSQPATISQFAIRYLNAIRVGENALIAAPSDHETPNACLKCSRRPDCWAAFGSDGDYGLFPFNAVALAEFSRRTGALSDKRFNPRRFLGAVVEPVLGQQYSDLEQGVFPDGSLLDRVGGQGHLPPILKAQIQQIDPQNFERRVALLELWDGSGKIVNLSPGVHDAFNLPQLLNVPTADTPMQPAPVTANPAVPGDDQAGDSAYIEAIRSWAGDATAQLSQSLVNHLRDLVFASLEAFIDWDALGIIKREACGSIFEKTSINFDRQQAAKSQKTVTLTLPQDPSALSHTAVALEALVRARQHGGWAFDSGLEQLAFLQNALESWASEVVEQIRDAVSKTEAWDPIVASTELLTLAELQSGRVRITDTNEMIVAKLFERSDKPSTFDATTARLRQLNGQLIERWEHAHNVLLSLASGLKGGQRGNFVRATPVLRAVESLRQRGLRLRQQVPDEITGAGRKQSDLVGLTRRVALTYRDVQRDYLEALRIERTSWNEWLDTVTLKVGLGTLSELISALTATMEDAENIALPLGQPKLKLREQIAMIDGRRLDRGLSQLRGLGDASDGEAILRLALSASTRPDVDALVEKAVSFLDHLEGRLQNELVQINLTVGEGLDNSKKSIAESLTQLVDALEHLAPTERVSS